MWNLVIKGLLDKILMYSWSMLKHWCRLMLWMAILVEILIFLLLSCCIYVNRNCAHGTIFPKWIFSEHNKYILTFALNIESLGKLLLGPTSRRELLATIFGEKTVLLKKYYFNVFLLLMPKQLFCLLPLIFKCE